MLSHFLNDIDTSNTINSKKIYYFINETSLNINPVMFPDLGALVVVNCTDVSIQNLNIIRNYCGLNLFSVANCEIINNTLSNNLLDGIKLQFGNNCEISNNTLTKNGKTAISISDSENFQISQNNMTCFGAQGITIYGSNNIAIVENDIEDGCGGIELGSSNYNTIFNNTMSGSLGFWLSNSSHNFLHSNFMSRLEWGSNGIVLGGSDYNEIVGNSFVTTNGNTGVQLDESCFNSFIQNNFTNYYTVFDCYRSNNNTIVRNRMQSRERTFYFLEFNNNSIYHNSILGETEVWDWGRAAANARISVNQWDNGIEGNYWSDNNGIDSNCDGIADEAYIIDEGAQDRYPLMAPIKVFDAGTWEGTPFSVGVVSNSTITDFSFSPDSALIQFDVDGENGTTGFCRVTIPKNFLNATEDNWTVTVEGNHVTPKINEDTNGTYLYFTYSHSTKTVTIIGTDAIPEFPSWIIAPIFLITTLIGIFYRNRVKK
jgi:parallel beta-helix repeat protein